MSTKERKRSTLANLVQASASSRMAAAATAADRAQIADGWLRWPGDFPTIAGCVSGAAGRSRGRRTVSTHPDDAASIGDATFKLYLTQRVSHPEVSTRVWADREPASSSAVASAA
jgi:hypothetical protein